VSSVGFSPDGAYIVLGSIGNSVHVWDVKTGREIVKPFEGHMKEVVSVSFSPDGTRIVSGSVDHSIRVWDACLTTGKTRKPLNEAHTSPISFVACSHDKYIVSMGSYYDSTVRLWDSKTGEQIMKKHVSGLCLVNVSPDTSCIIFGSRDGCVRVWDVQSGKEVMTLRPANDLVSSLVGVGFLSHGTCIYAGTSCGNIWIWDVRTGKEVLKLNCFQDGLISSLCFSPAGNFIASRSSLLHWQHGCVIHCWNASDMVKTLYQLYSYNTIASICFSPDESQAAATKDDSIVILNAMDKWQIIQTISLRFDVTSICVTSICFSLDGRHMVSGWSDSKVRIWDVRTGKAFMKPLEGHTAPIRSVSVSADGSRILSGSDDKTIRVWDVELAEITHVLPDSGFMDRITLSLDHQNDGTVTMLNPHCITQAFSWNCKDYSSKGWITGPKGELVLWVPPKYHPHLMLPPCTLLIGSPQVSFDLNWFVHGVEWTKCWSQTL